LNSTIMLAPLVKNDIEAVLRIERVSFAQPWGRGAVAEELTVAGAVHTAARMQPAPRSAADLVGFIFARLLYEEVHVMKIAVDPRWRRRGLATALLEATLARTRPKGALTALLEVRPGNTAAIGFYRQQGFTTIGIRPNYYLQTGENALVMSRAL
jgi:ribosomal-protein-alanine N-acetyltransferase